MLTNHCGAAQTVKAVDLPVETRLTAAVNSFTVRAIMNTLHDTRVKRNLPKICSNPVGNRSQKKKTTRPLKYMFFFVEYQTKRQSGNCWLIVNQRAKASAVMSFRTPAWLIIAFAKHGTTWRIYSLKRRLITDMQSQEVHTAFQAFPSLNEIAYIPFLILFPLSVPFCLQAEVWLHWWSWRGTNGCYIYYEMPSRCHSQIIDFITFYAT